jgi:UDP-glucose 4-epimerase
MRTLVTGGAGFIGSHITELLLSHGHEVTVLDNFSTGNADNLIHLGDSPMLTIVREDIAGDSDLAPHFENKDWVFHLAALADIVPSVEHPFLYHRSNVHGTVRVLEAARKARVKRFLYAASSSCYGIPDLVPTSETAEIRPQYPYALTKYIGEEYVLHWSKVYGLPVVSLRLFNVYGPRSRTSGTYGAVFGVFLAQKLAGKPFTVVGDGKQSRDFTFVKDVAMAFLAAAQSDITSQVFNVGSGKTYSINLLVDLIGGGDVIHIPRRPGEPERTHADISKIHRVMGWEPAVTFESGVQTLLANIEYWRKAPVWDPTTIARATEAWHRALGPGE